MLPSSRSVADRILGLRIYLISVILGGFTVLEITSESRNVICPSLCKCSADHDIYCNKMGIEDLPPDLPPSAVTLNLAVNQIRILHFDAFKVVPSLQMLWLNQNNLTFLYPGVFIALNNLKELNLSKNQRLTYLHAHTFRGLSSLVSLDLSHCNIFEIHPFVFTHLPSLEVLSLASNKIHYVPQALRKLHNVTRLSMENNFIEAIGKNSFKNQQALQALNLRRNQIWAIQHEAFNQLNKLSVLNLGHNSLSHLPNQLFSGLDELRIMYLEANRIVKINCSFNRLVNLKKLHLNNNLITHITRNAFSNLKQLQFLHLNKNSLTSVPSYLFLQMPNLKSVFLSFNPWSCDCSMAWIATWMVDYKGIVQGLNCVFALSYRTNSEIFTGKGVTCFHEDITEEQCVESSTDSASALTVIPYVIFTILICFSGGLM
ncbi:PREDICTED: nyctalopin-like [Nanorana parkeri]|uniref:nyctalopin-like n=1 Tax=Nanorana parkeri TaxID=125878 RepID=UPI00085443E3|nr:PREDICTED: nyctalopin-like [Nanorana parkeri]